ncbi:hypothetical protein D3C75_505890 [compost metagenome]
MTSERDFYDEEHDMEQLTFESKIARLHISFCTLIEVLNMPSLLEQYKSDFLKFEGKHAVLDMLPYIGEFHSETLSLFWRYHKTLSSLIGHNVQEKLIDERISQFESILINTPKIVKDRGIEPSNEAEVRKCVYDLLIHIFPDTVREIPIAQETKTYKPDLGVKSLKVAAEYKFADSAEEVKKAVGGLYEDMRGYAGSEDWKHFYAVVYITDAYFTPEQIMSEFNHTGTDDNWKPILVFGKGSRKKRNI